MTRNHVSGPIQMLYRSGLRSLLTCPFSRFSNRTVVSPGWLDRPRIVSVLSDKSINPLLQSAHNQLTRHVCASPSSRNALLPLARQPFGIELCGKVASLLNGNGVENLLWGSHLMATYTVPVVIQVQSYSLTERPSLFVRYGIADQRFLRNLPLRFRGAKFTRLSTLWKRKASRYVGTGAAPGVVGKRQHGSAPVTRSLYTSTWTMLRPVISRGPTGIQCNFTRWRTFCGKYLRKDEE
jgi:hypothetical protein